MAAQDAGGTYSRAVAELRAGRKASHWMWFVVPQIAGLGRSATAQEFAISSLDEARAYLRHPVLGPRLADSARVRAGPGDPQASPFAQVLSQYFDGQPDPATDRLLGPGS